MAYINEAVENENSTELIEKMNNENAGLTRLDDSLCNRYLSHLMSVKEEKAQVRSNLTYIQSQTTCSNKENSLIGRLNPRSAKLFKAKGILF